jgi:hypothetical protein
MNNQLAVEALEKLKILAETTAQDYPNASISAAIAATKEQQ